MCGCGCSPLHHREGYLEEHQCCCVRGFLTKAEKAERLKSYAEDLRKELAAVEEHIRELGTEGK
jgi:hypothetical protein